MLFFYFFLQIILRAGILRNVAGWADTFLCLLLRFFDRIISDEKPSVESNGDTGYSGKLSGTRSLDGSTFAMSYGGTGPDFLLYRPQ
jgi:hypothetical protein